MMRRTVILAAGDFPPRGSEPERLLLSAARVVACDSAAATYRQRFGRWPDVIIGDLDSFLPKDACGAEHGGDGEAETRRVEPHALSFQRTPCLPSSITSVLSESNKDACGAEHGETEARRRVVRIDDDETNDLDKAIAYCRTQGWADLVIVGATGRRTDHAIGNVYRALAAEVPIVEAEGAFLPVRGKLTFRTWKDAGVSVFAPDPATRMTSRGLRWKLDGVRFANPYCATLNRASSETVTVTSTHPAFVYAARNPAAVRAVVALGSNVGARATYLKRALAALAALPETRLLDVSAVRETEPVDVPAEFAAQKFLNQAAVFETTLAPLAFSRAMHAVEDRLGRVRTVRNGPRTIDLDLILFGDVRLDTSELTLPHPRAQERAFVLDPLNELGIRLPLVACGAERGGDGASETRSPVPSVPSPTEPPCLPSSAISVLSESNSVVREEAYGVQRGGGGESETRSSVSGAPSPKQPPCLPSSITSVLSDSNPVGQEDAYGVQR